MEKQLKKILLIIGSAASGKSVLARSIAAQHNPGEVYWIDAHAKSLLGKKHLFQGLTPNHKLIIMDDLLKSNKLEMFYEFLHHEISINPKGKASFSMLAPAIVITSDQFTLKELQEKPESFHNRFDVVEINGCGFNNKSN